MSRTFATTLCTLLAAAAWLAGCSGEPSAPVARNVVLVSIDTLRADRLGAYGHTRPTSPELDAFAARGVVFEDASATSAWTQPSHASMLTGRYPAQAGMRRLTEALPASVPSLAGLLRQADFETVGLANSVFLGALRRDFDHWEYVPEAHSAEGAGATLTDLAIRALREAGGPLFLFVHYYDVHSAYRSRPEFEAPFLEGRRLEAAEPSAEFLLRVNEGDAALSPGDREVLERLYEAGIRQLDVEVGRLLRAVEAELGWDETLVIVTSDHGDAFQEHGRLSHGDQLYQEAVHVPLIVFGAGVPAGRRVAAPVSLVDVLPTALEAAGLSAPPDVAGVGLAGHWRDPGAPGAERALYAQSTPAFRGDSRRMLRQGRLKLLVDTEAGTRELYDLATDPDETRNLADARPEQLARLTASLEAFFAAYPDDAAPFPELDDGLAEHLKSLGYLE